MSKERSNWQNLLNSFWSKVFLFYSREGTFEWNDFSYGRQMLCGPHPVTPDQYYSAAAVVDAAVAIRQQR